MSRWFVEAWTIAGKDLRIELRTKEVLVTAGLFGLLVTVLTSLAFFLDDSSARKIAPGVLWVSTCFAGVLAMGRIWGREREHDALVGLLLSPASRSAIYAGKATATLMLLLVIEAALVPVVGLLFRLELGTDLAPMAFFLVLGTVGYVALGTLFAAMSVRTRARDLMLSVVLFPLTAPALIAGVVATREAFAGAPFSELLAWARILMAFDLMALAAGLWLFGLLLRD